jgi:hypothetical protein
VGIFRSSRSFIDGSSFFFVSGTDVAFWARSATSRPQTNNIMLARHRHGLEVEDEGHLKDFDVIFFFVEMFCLFCCLF